ncbi:MAG: ATP-binding protein, partial [Pseudomonadota bacterium]
AYGRQLLAKDGTLLGAVASMIDQTEVKARQAEVQKAKKELDLMLDNIPVRVWYKDDQNKIIRANRAATEATPKPSIATHDDEASRVIATGEPSFGVVEAGVAPNGEPEWMSTTRVPYKDPESGRDYIFVAATDVTGIQEAKRLLDEKNADLRNFARMASHDLQEPLRKILVFSEFLEDALGEKLKGEAQDDLSAIRSSATRMQVLIKDVLELAQVPDATIAMEPMPIKPLVHSVIDAMEIDHGKVDVIVEIPGSIIGLADRALLYSVMQNLISNAIKFSQYKEERWVHISAVENESVVTIRVEDNGIGIPDKDREQIFDALTRLHSRDQFEGTGIGLAICARNIERMKGDIWAKAAQSGGTIMNFTLTKPEIQSNCVA